MISIYIVDKKLNEKFTFDIDDSLTVKHLLYLIKNELKIKDIEYYSLYSEVED